MGEESHKATQVAEGGARALPYRQLSRLCNELALSGSANLATLVDGGFSRGIILLLLLRVAVRDWTAGGRLTLDRPVTCPVSISALATSLGRPFETMRRQVHAMADDGLCAVGGSGVVATCHGAAEGRLGTLLVNLHDEMIRLIEDLAQVGHLPHRVARHASPPTEHLGLVLATALDCHLQPLEMFDGRIGDWTSMQLLMGIGVANTRHITINPDLSARFAYQSTPDDLRWPAAIPGVAAILGMPAATAWRHRARLEKAGLVVRQGRGWIIPTRRLRDDTMEPAVVGGVDYALRRIGDLGGAGLDLRAPALLYINGRPPYVPLGSAVV